MAFVSLFFAFVFIAVIILGAMTVIGLIFLILGLVKNKKYKKLGRKKKYPYVFITFGTLFLILPSFTFQFILGTSIRTNIQRLFYKNVVDEWKHENVSDEYAAEKAIEELLEAADSNDKDEIIVLFSENIQDDPELEEQVEEFLDEYSGDLSGGELNIKGGSSSGGSADGKIVDTFSFKYEMDKDGEYYYIVIDACYRNNKQPEELGITEFYIHSEKCEDIYMNLNSQIISDEYIKARLSEESYYELVQSTN